MYKNNIYIKIKLLTIKSNQYTLNKHTYPQVINTYPQFINKLLTKILNYVFNVVI